jgi:peptide/nickel transport system substrate-binding protein/oligopeptide transport system substrate-binding protein
MQRTSTLALTLCLLSLLLSACNGSTLVKAPLNKQTYSVPIVGVEDLDTLDPALAHDPNSINAIQMIYTGLVGLNDTLQVSPQIAASWEVDARGTTWTFHLRPHLKFSDNTNLTSADVAYSIDRALQPATKSTVAPLYLSLIKDSDQLLTGKIATLIGDSILTPDSQTVVIITKQKAANFLSMLTSTCAYVVEKSLIAKYSKKFTDHLAEGGATGPFKVAHYVHRSTITFVPNTHYYNTPPQLQNVTFTFYHTAQAAYQDYLHKKLDVVQVPLSKLDQTRKNPEFHQVKQLWINYYAMNYLTKPFDNIHIRQAFALAIDKTAIAKHVWKDTLMPTNHIVPAGMTGYNPDLKGPDSTQNVTGNTKRAQQLLQQGLREEGWASVSEMPPITLSYVSNTANFDQEASTLIRQWQKVLGITVLTDPEDGSPLLDKVTNATNNPQGIQMWGLTWVGEYPDPQDWLSQQFGKGSPNNNMNYGQNTSQDAAKQQLTQHQLETADGTLGDTQQAERVHSYQQAEQQIVNDVAWIPMGQMNSLFLRSTSIVGFRDNAQGIVPPDDWASIYRAQSA